MWNLDQLTRTALEMEFLDWLHLSSSSTFGFQNTQLNNKTICLQIWLCNRLFDSCSRTPGSPGFGWTTAVQMGTTYCAILSFACIKEVVQSWIAQIFMISSNIDYRHNFKRLLYFHNWTNLRGYLSLIHRMCDSKDKKWFLLFYTPKWTCQCSRGRTQKTGYLRSTNEKSGYRMPTTMNVRRIS